jgi:hypothetical protein
MEPPGRRCHDKGVEFVGRRAGSRYVDGVLRLRAKEWHNTSSVSIHFLNLVSEAPTLTPTPGKEVSINGNRSRMKQPAADLRHQGIEEQLFGLTYDAIVTVAPAPEFAPSSRGRRPLRERR